MFVGNYVYATMELSDLKKCVDSAISNCQEMLFANPNLVLSEGDFEKLSGKVIQIPLREQIDVPVNETLIVELYSK